MTRIILILVLSVLVQIITSIMLNNRVIPGSGDESMYSGLKFKGAHKFIDLTAFMAIIIFITIICIVVATKENDSYSINIWTAIEFVKYYLVPINIILVISRLLVLITISYKNRNNKLIKNK